MSNIVVSEISRQMRGSLFRFGDFGETPSSLLKVYNYDVSKITASSGDNKVNFADMALVVLLKRARRVEEEINPQATEITQRNAQLEELGEALSAASNIQAATQTSSPPKNVTDNSLGPKVVSTLIKYGLATSSDGVCNDNTFTPGEAAEAVQLLKSRIDTLNNDAQADMTRLQQLVDKRDESFTLSADLVTKISDTRSASIRNIN